MTRRRIVCPTTVLAVCILALVALGARPAVAAPDPEGLKACARAYDACTAQCTRDYPDNQASRAGCGARCAGERAACEAKAGYEKAKPWVEKQIEGLQDFLDGFRGDPPPEDPRPAPSEPAPTPTPTPERDGDGPYKDI